MTSRVRVALCALVVAVLATPGHAQAGEKLQFRGGFSFEFVPVEYPDGTNFFLNDQLLYGILLGGEYTLFQSNDLFALNADLGINFSFNYSNFYGSQLFLQTPLYLVAKVGAGATKYTDFPVGAALGVGLAYTFVNIPFSTNQAVAEISRLKPSWVAPSAMAQLTLRTNQGTYGIRGHLNLSSFTENTTIEGFVVPLRYENWGVGLVYTFE